MERSRELTDWIAVRWSEHLVYERGEDYRANVRLRMIARKEWRQRASEMSPREKDVREWIGETVDPLERRQILRRAFPWVR